MSKIGVGRIEGISYKEVGNRIRSLREANEYTREVFSEKIDISAKYLYEIEMGKKGFSAEILYKIARLCYVSCDYLLTGDNPNPLSDVSSELLTSFEPEQFGYLHEILRNIHSLTVHYPVKKDNHD